MADDHEEVGHDTIPNAPARRPMRQADANMLVNGMMDFMRCTLEGLFHPNMVDTAMKQAMKQPSVKAMFTHVKLKGKKPQVRSGYNMWISDALHNLKQAGINVGLPEISSVWKVLPEGEKARLMERYKAVMPACNTIADGGDQPSVPEEMASYAEANELEPINYVHLYTTYKNAAAAAAAAEKAEKAAAAANGVAPKGKGKAKPKAPVPAAAAAAAAATPASAAPTATPGTGTGKRIAEGDTEQKHHKKHKKDKEKKEKKDKEKKKKHKKEEVSE